MALAPDVLTQVADCAVQVRGAASVTAEREARALAALEKSSAERAAALAARERLLQEREEKVRVIVGFLTATMAQRTLHA